MKRGRRLLIFDGVRTFKNLQSNTRFGNRRSKLLRLALLIIGTLLLVVPDSLALAASNSIIEMRGSGAEALSMTDQEVAATIAQMGLKLSAKPSREMIRNWHKPTKAIVFAEGSPQWLPWLKTVAPGMKFVLIDGSRTYGVEHDPARMKALFASHSVAGLTKQQLADVADADVQIGGICDKSIVQAAKKLQLIISAHAGVETCFSGDVPKRLLDGEVIETNQQKTYGLPIGTHAIAMMLALDRGLDLYVRMNDAERWVETPPGKLRFPQGETMLVVGLGGIGTTIARLGHDLGMKIIATRATSHEGPSFVDYVGLSNELPDLIGKADVVVATLPVTKDTIHLFNSDLFGRMKKGALFINVARGALVDSSALVAALRSGQVGGAGLDVTDPEILPKGDPLWHAPNVIITPHMSAHFSTGNSAEEPGNHTIEVWAVMRENLRRYIAGDKLYSVVDPRAQY